MNNNTKFTLQTQKKKFVHVKCKYSITMFEMSTTSTMLMIHNIFLVDCAWHRNVLNQFSSQYTSDAWI